MVEEQQYSRFNELRLHNRSLDLYNGLVREDSGALLNSPYVAGELEIPEIIKKILKEVSVPIQLGGGIRSVEYARELLDLDIERIIIGTMGIENPKSITELSEEYGSDRIMISLDSKDNKVVIKGWKEKLK